MILPSLDISMDWAPEFCFCGKKTVESHEFWFCSTGCARSDSLQSLDGPNSHYRNVVRKSIASGLQPTHMVGSRAAPPFTPPTNALHRDATTTCKREGVRPGFPTLSQVAGKVLINKAATGKPLVSEKHDRPRWAGFPNAPSRGYPAQSLEDYQLSLGANPVLGHTPARTLKRSPTSTEGLRNDTRRPAVGGLPNTGRFHRGQEGDTSERGLGRAVPSLPSDQQINPDLEVSVRTAKALRRSVSLGGRSATLRSGLSTEQDSLLNMIEEIRQDFSAESFDPRSLFDEEE